jgi:hypothetical protein
LLLVAVEVAEAEPVALELMVVLDGLVLVAVAVVLVLAVLICTVGPLLLLLVLLVLVVLAVPAVLELLTTQVLVEAMGLLELLVE